MYEKRGYFYDAYLCADIYGVCCGIFCGEHTQGKVDILSKDIAGGVFHGDMVWGLSRGGGCP